ncbi:MAG: hypothetical protein LBH48_01315 [Bifidobacteriaceae bacterium]|nr:hypothetical protein [Bifidobacteriaceae bacterium]
MTPQTWRIVTVCTGNVCRSPLAAALINHWAAQLDHTSDIHATSTGVMAAIGAPMHPDAIAIARALGADPAPHRGAQLTIRDLRGANLVLAAARTHRAEVARILPSAAPYSYTIRELAHLSGLKPVPTDSHTDAVCPSSLYDTASVRLGEIARRRGLAPRTNPDDDDIADPINGGEAAFRRMETELVPALRAVFDALFLPQVIQVDS